MHVSPNNVYLYKYPILKVKEFYSSLLMSELCIPYKDYRMGREGEE
jgi:hypothetical protein